MPYPATRKSPTRNPNHVGIQDLIKAGLRGGLLNEEIAQGLPSIHGGKSLNPNTVRVIVAKLKRQTPELAEAVRVRKKQLWLKEKVPMLLFLASHPEMSRVKQACALGLTLTGLKKILRKVKKNGGIVPNNNESRKKFNNPKYTPAMTQFVTAHHKEIERAIKATIQRKRDNPNYETEFEGYVWSRLPFVFNAFTPTRGTNLLRHILFHIQNYLPRQFNRNNLVTQLKITYNRAGKMIRALRKQESKLPLSEQDKELIAQYHRLKITRPAQYNDELGYLESEFY